MDLASAYLGGVQTAQNARFKQQELAQRQQQMVMQQQESESRIAASQQESQRAHNLEAQRLKVQGQVQQQRLDLESQRVKSEAAKAQQQTQIAAAKIADQRGFAEDLKNGLSVEQALFRHPSVSSPQAVETAHRDAANFAEKQEKDTLLKRQLNQKMNEDFNKDTERRKSAQDKKESTSDWHQYIEDRDSQNRLLRKEGLKLSAEKAGLPDPNADATPEAPAGDKPKSQKWVWNPKTGATEPADETPAQ